MLMCKPHGNKEGGGSEEVQEEEEVDVEEEEEAYCWTAVAFLVQRL